MNQEEIDEILAHAGVKGMKWGKRAQIQTTTSDQKSSIVDKYNSLSSGKKTAIKVGTGVAIAAGSAAVGAVLARRGQVSVKDARSVLRSALNRTNEASLALSRYDGVKVSSILANEAVLSTNLRQIMDTAF